MALHERHIEEMVAKYVKTGNLMAVGTSSLGKSFLRKLAFALEDEAVDLWNVSIVPTSFEIASVANSLGIKIESINEREIDVAVEFADCADRNFSYIKSDSTSLVRDKMIARSAATLIVITEEERLRERLNGKVAFEVSSFGWKRTLNELEAFGKASLREAKGRPYKTESGSCLIDVDVDEIYNAEELEERSKNIPGVLETGLFIGYADRVITHGRTHLKVKSRMEYR
jgi:ribose 5-phosphate isomerase A